MSRDDSGKTCAFDLCCGCVDHCCRDARPPLTAQRRKIIEEYLNKNKIAVKNPFAHGGYHFAAADKAGLCFFYDKEKRQCLIHPVKPETCRAGPVTFDINRSTRKVEWHLKMTEVCKLAKRLLENPERSKEHLEIAKKEIMQLICQLEPEDLLAILKIPEPLTFKIGEDNLPQEAARKLGLE